MAWTDPVRLPNVKARDEYEDYFNDTVVDNLIEIKNQVLPTDEPANNDVLKYTTGVGPNWAPAGGGTDVVWAGTSNLFNYTSAVQIINNWTTLVSNGATSNGTSITVSSSGIYEVAFQVCIANQTPSTAQSTDVIVIDELDFVQGGSVYASLPNYIPCWLSGNFVTSLAAGKALRVKASQASATLLWTNNKHSLVIRKIG